MPIRVAGELVENVYIGGIVQDQCFVGGEIVYQKGGLPGGTIRVEPDQRLVGDGLSVVVTYEPDGLLTGGTLERIRPDGLRTVFLHLNTDARAGDPTRSSPTVYADGAVPDMVGTTRYLVVPANANGTSVLEADFERGTAAAITTWRWYGFQQGIFGRDPDTVVLEWGVTGDPAPTLEITSSAGAVHYHPGTRRSGTYRYTRVGVRVDERLTLTASNRFATASQTITVPWRREGG